MKSTVCIVLMFILISCSNMATKEILDPSIREAEREQSMALPTSVILPIPDRLDDPDAPAVGWCGETSIQMGMAYYGVEISQKVIHAAGKPAHPDIWEDDIDLALDTLGVEYSAWNEQIHTLSDFILWIKDNLARGYPVLCGLKLYPTEYPEWSFDHFVLIVGYNEKGFYINTNNTGDGQILVEYSKLSSLTNKYSFENQSHRYFGRALQGIRNVQTNKKDVR